MTDNVVIAAVIHVFRGFDDPAKRSQRRSQRARAIGPGWSER